jgi:hypothetical protein
MESRFYTGGVVPRGYHLYSDQQTDAHGDGLESYITKNSLPGAAMKAPEDGFPPSVTRGGLIGSTFRLQAGSELEAVTSVAQPEWLEVRYPKLWLNIELYRWSSTGRSLRAWVESLIILS